MTDESIAVLYVGDVSTVADALADRDDRIVVTTVTTAGDALDRLAEGGVDCLVTAYRLPGMDGLGLLAAVRESHPDVPVVLYPDNGSEAVASRAISAGVTDYIRRGRDGDHARLADRIVGAAAACNDPGESGGTGGEVEGKVEGERLKDRAMDAAPIGIVIAIRRGENDPIVYANERFCELTGYDEAEVIGRDCRFLQGPDTDPEQVARFREAIEAEEPATVVLRNYRKDGTEFWNRVTIAPVGDPGTTTHFVGFQQDVTERKERERELRRQNARLENLHEATHNLLQAPDRDRAIEVAVASVEEVLDLPVATLWTYDEERAALVPAATTDRARELVGEAPTYREGEGLSWEAFVANATRVFDDVSSVPERYNADTPIRSEIILPIGEQGIMNIGSTEPAAFDDADVTVAELWAATVSVALDRLDRERELETRERELTRERNRLDEFASLVSHDLRNPLNVATGNLDLAREECESEHLDAVANALGRMEVLVDDMLALARDGTAVRDVEPVSLGDLARRGWTNVATPDATLRVETDATVVADGSRLTQVFENLFRNAVEHGRGDGGAGADGDFTVTVGDLDGGFYVADDGRGVPPTERDRLFEAGYSTNEGGTGVGLKIVRDIVEAHGWDIGVTESASGGARFEVTGVDVGE